LALIEQKPGALDQARPLQGWPLPEQFEHLRRLLEARMGNRGKREFIQVLRLPDQQLSAWHLTSISSNLQKNIPIREIRAHHNTDAFWSRLPVLL
jgi:hypothetical protein